MQFVQLTLTTDHVAELWEALANTVVDPKEDPESVIRLGMLQMFLGQVLEHPEAFRVSGRMAQAIKSRTRKLKGPAQPKPRGPRRRSTRNKKRRGRA